MGAQRKRGEEGREAPVPEQEGMQRPSKVETAKGSLRSTLVDWQRLGRTLRPRPSKQERRPNSTSDVPPGHKVLSRRSRQATACVQPLIRSF